MSSTILSFLFATILGALGFLFSKSDFAKKGMIFWTWLILLCGTIGFGVYSLIQQSNDIDENFRTTKESINENSKSIKNKIDSINPNSKLFPLNLCTFQNKLNPILVRGTSKDSVVLQIGICNRLSRGISNMSDKVSLVIFKSDTITVSEESHPSSINSSMTFYPGDNFQININLKREKYREKGYSAYCCYWIKENGEKRFIIAIDISNMIVDVPLSTANQKYYELIVTALDKANLW